MLELLAFLAQPLITLGGIVGLLVGTVAAAGLHWLFPNQNLVVLQALFLAIGFIVGLVVGSSMDRHRKAE